MICRVCPSHPLSQLRLTPCVRHAGNLATTSGDMAKATGAASRALAAMRAAGGEDDGGQHEQQAAPAGASEGSGSSGGAQIPAEQVRGAACGGAANPLRWPCHVLQLHIGSGEPAFLGGGEGGRTARAPFSPSLRGRRELFSGLCPTRHHTPHTRHPHPHSHPPTHPPAHPPHPPCSSVARLSSAV